LLVKGSAPDGTVGISHREEHPSMDDPTIRIRSRLRIAPTTLVGFGLLAIIATPARAEKYDIAIPSTGFVQSEFRDLTEELGIALAYRPLAPAEPLGLLGFDIGLEVTSVNINGSSSFWTEAMGNQPSPLAFPKLHLQKGLPFGIDVGFVYTEIPSSNVGMYGGELKWAILKGSLATPAVALRGTYTALTGVDTMDLSTYGADISISKGIGPLTPYAGIGEIWINSSTTVPGLNDESISTSHYFVGTKLSFLLLSLALEADFAEVPSYGFRVGLVF
jgi:hypothetical protein